MVFIVALLSACHRVPVDQLITDLTDPDPAVRDQAAHKLVDARNRSVPALAGLLEKEDESLRLMALQILGKINTREAGQAALAGFKDTNPDIRLQTARIFGTLALPDNALPVFIQAAGDPFWQVRLEIVQVLSRYATLPALKALAGRLEDSREEIRTAAIQALLIMRNPEVVGVLIKALDNRDDQVRYIAVQALGTLEDTVAIAPLLKILAEEQNTYLRQKSAIALGLLKSHRAVPLLQEMSRTGNADEKKAALQALGIINAK